LNVNENEITLEEALRPSGDYWPEPLRDIFSKINRSNDTTFVNRICKITGYTVTESWDYFEELIVAGVVHREESGYTHITSIEEETQKRREDFKDNVS